VTTVVLELDDALNAALEALSREQGRDKTTLLGDILRRHVQDERLRQELRDPELAKLYHELEAEDRALAEVGLADYKQMLDDADRP
jgi:hypothetical protein